MRRVKACACMASDVVGRLCDHRVWDGRAGNGGPPLQGNGIDLGLLGCRFLRKPRPCLEIESYTVGAGFKPALCSTESRIGEGRFETCPYGT